MNKTLNWRYWIPRFCYFIFLAFVFSACSNNASTDDNYEIMTTSYEQIVINEVQSKGVEGFLSSDFVELYNDSDEPYTFSEGEWYITDTNGTMNSIMYIPGGTQIEANGFLVLLPDEETLPDNAPANSLPNLIDGINLRFGLGSEDIVSLYYMGGSNPTPDIPIDSASWTKHVRTRARIPDGGEWLAGDSQFPTPGASNQTRAMITGFSIVDPPVSGVIDETAKTITVSVPAGTDVMALVAEFDFSGVAIEVAGVMQESGVTVNDFSSSVFYTVTAYDGNSVVYAVTVDVAYDTGVVINEVQSNDTEGYFASDYIELYNTTDSDYLFADGEWYITDSDVDHIFNIPGGTTIEAHGYLVLLPDEETVPPDAPVNSLAYGTGGFGLGSSDAVFLYYTGSGNPLPEVAVDSTSWTSHVTTRSRIPDGGDWRPTDDSIPTPGMSNGL